MRQDRENYMRGQGKEPQQPNINEEHIQVGKWGKKKSTSRERQIDSPRFGENKQEEEAKNEEGKGFSTLIHDSENMFLEAKNPL